MSYEYLGDLSIPTDLPKIGTAAPAFTESARRAVLDPLVTEYRDRVAVTLNSRIDAADSVLNASGYMGEALMYGYTANPKIFHEKMSENVHSVVVLVADLKAQAEKALNEFTLRARQIVPRDPYQLNLAVPSEWAIVNTRDALAAARDRADAILRKWMWSERNELTLSETMSQEYGKVFGDDPNSWKNTIIWAAGLLLAANIIGALRR